MCSRVASEHERGVARSVATAMVTAPVRAAWVSDTGLCSSLWRFGLMYVGAWRAELTSAQSEGNDRESDRFRLSAKRVTILAGLGVVLPTLMVWNHVGFWLDDLLFPKWRQQAVRKPVFIVGNARSGTTWIHRLLSLDAASFSAPKLWEIVFAQSVTWRVLFHGLGNADAAVGSPVRRALRVADRAVAGGSELHPFGLWEAEEDEWLLLNAGACQLSALMFPLSADGADLVDFDRTMPARERAAVFAYYRSCLQRHLFAHRWLGLCSAESRYMSKNPTFTLRLRSVMEAFPDAAVVVMVRDPWLSVPSMVSYICKCWAVFASPVARYPFQRGLMAMCSRHYTYPRALAASCDSWGKAFHFVRYEECVEDLQGACRRIYGAIGVALTADMETLLATRKAPLAKAHTSSHKYDVVKTCGVSHDAFAQLHAEAFGLYPDYAHAAPP